MRLLFIDFESFYSSKQKYDLRAMSMVEYIRDPRFQAFGLAYAWNDSHSPLWVSAKDIPNWLNFIAKEIGWPNIAVVGHNIKFDAFILHHVYEVVPGQFIDTKGMSKAVLGKSVKGHSLQLLSEHFGLESKGVMLTDNKIVLTMAEEAALATYCIHDVELCRILYSRMANNFPQSQYAAMHRTVDMFVSPKLQLNVPLLEQTSIQEAARRANIFTEIGTDIPKEFWRKDIGLKKGKLQLEHTTPTSDDIKSIFASNIKFPALLISKGYEVPKKPSTRRKDENGDPVEIPAIALGDPEFLEMLEGGNEELKTLCEARVAAKSTLLETRSAKLAKIGATGFWPFDVEFSGADQTHRFSGGSGAGGNPQNFTRGSALRTAVEAPNGYELVVGDFSNIELRIVAYLSKDPGLVQAIEKGIDIYCDFASVFYGRKITKKDEKERRFGKTAILGLGYGMGFLKFIKTVRVQTGETISEKDSRKAVELYRTRYSKVPALWESLDKMIPLIASGYSQHHYDMPVNISTQALTLPSGLKIRFPNLRQRMNEKGKPEWVYDVYKKRNLEISKLYGGKLLENISQGLAGELCKEAMLEMGDNVTGLVHDEIHIVCKKGLGRITAQKLKRVMSLSPDWMPQMELSAEVGVGTNWGSCK